ncbi:hypothetical protein KAH94_02280 [bacterium]|nr:hypothetical protein [bacterium]
MKKTFATITIMTTFLTIQAELKEEISTFLNPSFKKEEYNDKQKIAYINQKEKIEKTVKNNIKTLSSKQKVSSLQKIKIEKLEKDSISSIGPNLSQSKNFHEFNGRLAARQQALFQKCFKKMNHKDKCSVAVIFDIHKLKTYIYSKKHNDLIQKYQNGVIDKETLLKELQLIEKNNTKLMTPQKNYIWDTRGKVITKIEYEKYPLKKKVGIAAVSVAAATSPKWGPFLIKIIKKIPTLFSKSKR